ncbi:MAG TPA: DUF2917 domain-containing protein [Burkholderiaceae bacterium]|nr:DUF2917 domain-containing protein [Burkholderiaceae bacterium]HQR78059.1 DUF2917 domain-containing protein [Burkholderiaceae bacterium]
MNRNLQIFDADVTLSLDDTPLPMHLPAGAAIFALRGKVWITQERLRDDVVLAAGERFDVTSTELILASAISGSALVHVVPVAEARVNREHDIHDFMRARAVKLRREAVEHAVSQSVSNIATWIARARTLMTARPRVLGH